MDANLQNVRIQPIRVLSDERIQTDILRLDLFHPIVSGNKWFKLQYYLEEALVSQKKTIATFGGAFSNHIVATAFAAAELGLNSIGIIRGEKTGNSPTLRDAASYGMNLVYIDRNEYQNKDKIRHKFPDPGIYWVNEGGYGHIGAKGASVIIRLFDTTYYSHILCAVGTGTMMSGLINAVQPEQNVVGISILKNHFGLEKEMTSLLSETASQKRFSLIPDYHFGGYARQTPELFDFMNWLWENEQIPTDIVYTSKLVFAVKDLLNKGIFPEGSRLLIIHSGGIQGNRSVFPGKLCF